MNSKNYEKLSLDELIKLSVKQAKSQKAHPSYIKIIKTKASREDLIAYLTIKPSIVDLIALIYTD